MTRHPLQPFDPRNFRAGDLIADAPWSFDTVTLAGARALLGPRTARAAFLDGPLPPLETRHYELEDLIRFAQHPIKAFLRRRLQISLSDYTEEIADSLPVELDGLGRWDVGQRLLDALMAGVDERAATLAEIRRGALPPGRLGRPILVEAFATAKAIAEVARGQIHPDHPVSPVDVHLTVPGGRTLTGTVPGVSGPTLLAATFSRLAAKHRITAWVKLLALAASAPDAELCAVSVGKGARGSVAVQRIAALGADPEARAAIAEEKLGALLDLYDRGMREPLPIFPKTSAAYALASARGQDPVGAARSEWLTEWKYPREDQELEHQLVLGGVVGLDAVMALAPAADEFGAGWDPSEGTRFGRLACRLWDGLLEFEELS